MRAMGEPESDGPARAEGDRRGDGDREVAAWRTWLSALAKDAEAALAAAMTYASLESAARDAWLDALEADSRSVNVPPVALSAPLLAVEADAARRTRIEAAMGALGHRAVPTQALRAVTPSGECVCAVSTPIYLDFVELLVCRYCPERGVSAAYHEPFRHASEVEGAVQRAIAEPLVFERAPLGVVIEELAHAVVADRREGRQPPPALARFSHLFGPDLGRDGRGPESPLRPEDGDEDEEDCSAA
jgi:hypothetical protein